MSDLRARIAAILAETTTDLLTTADTLIQEIPLIQEHKLWGDGAVQKTRYVTPWTMVANE